MKRGPAHVLMTTDAVGGVWSYSVSLAEYLDAHGVFVTLVTMGPRPRPDQRERVRDLTNVELIETEFRLEWMDDSWSDVDRARAWLLELSERLRPDVVHLNGYCLASSSFEPKVVVVAHSCVLTWWKAVLGGDAPQRFEEYCRRVSEGLNAADVVVAPTRAMLQALADAYGSPRRASVIANGSRVPPRLPREKRPVFLAAGRVWDKAKNMALLLRIARHLPWPVRIAGDPANPEGQDGVTGGAELLGALESRALHAEMDGAAVFVHPALYEPFGLAPLEAAARGCALVLSDLPSLREVWGDAAVYVPPSNDERWIQVLSQLARDTTRRLVFSRRARRRAGQLTATRMGQRYLALYRRTLDASASEKVQLRSAS